MIERKNLILGREGTIINGCLAGQSGMVVKTDYIRNSVTIRIDRWCSIETNYENIEQSEFAQYLVTMLPKYHHTLENYGKIVFTSRWVPTLVGLESKLPLECIKKSNIHIIKIERSETGDFNKYQKENNMPKNQCVHLKKCYDRPSCTGPSRFMCLRHKGQAVVCEYKNMAKEKTDCKLYEERDGSPWKQGKVDIITTPDKDLYYS